MCRTGDPLSGEAAISCTSIVNACVKSVCMCVRMVCVCMRVLVYIHMWVFMYLALTHGTFRVDISSEHCV